MILLNDEELKQVLEQAYGFGIHLQKGHFAVSKAQLKKTGKWLMDNGAHFITKVEGHKGFYELDWETFEALLKEGE